MSIKKILFIDTNIWLDFYRGRTDISLKLLDHLEKISDSLVITYQLEMEFKKNRQNALLEGLKGLKIDNNISRPALFSDAQVAKTLKKHIEGASKSILSLEKKMKKAIESPSTDPVYKVCQRIFHLENDFNLTRENKIRHQIRRRAFRRFMHGCPPRKSNDTSIGDAINWEWMIECANNHDAELVIVTRDSDYGVTLKDKSFVNDHLKQEFSERVSRKRKILLYTRLSDALKHFKVAVTEQEVAAEEEIISSSKKQVTSASDFERRLKDFLQTYNTSIYETISRLEPKKTPSE